MLTKSIKELKEKGFKPSIYSFLWIQGVPDANDADCVVRLGEKMADIVLDFINQKAK